MAGVCFSLVGRQPAHPSRDRLTGRRRAPGGRLSAVGFRRLPGWRAHRLASEPVERALAADLLPVVRGDVAFDRERGSSIVSTEKVMTFLAPILRPSLVLLAGVEPGVFADFPRNQQLLPEITPEMLANIRLGGARSTDVTGGMADKVNQAFALAKAVSGVQVRIFSGMESGTVRQALAGAPVGTLIRLT